MPRWCAHCAHGDARELQGGRGKNISAEESENFLAKDKFLGSGEHGRGERGPAADRIIFIVVHVKVIWSLVVGGHHSPVPTDWLQIIFKRLQILEMEQDTLFVVQRRRRI